MIKALKILRLLMYFLYGGALVVLQTLILRRDAQDPRFKAIVQNWYKKACQLVGITVVVHGKPQEGPVLMVANHVSWLDIPLMASQSNPRFLSKAEIRKWPIIGWVAEKLHTLFIVRGQHSATEAVSAAIVEGLEQGDCLLIFPEGRTTAGNEVGFLFPRLFGAAIQTESNVQPVVIHYTDDNGTGHSSDLVPYIGQQTLVANLWAVLGCKNLQAQIYFLDAVATKDRPRKALSADIQRQMQDCLEQSHARCLAEKATDP